jgi:YgiT-type zinc finger domain-containing protein
MKCHTPDCTGEHQTQPISHSVIYRERRIVFHAVPAEVCPECGEAVLVEETTLYLDDLLRRKARAKGTKRSAFAYEA